MSPVSRPGFDPVFCSFSKAFVAATSPEDIQPYAISQILGGFINPWALEVMARHPEIEICDQHGLISNEKF